MPVFFIPADAIKESQLSIDGPLFDHLVKSLRFREGDELTLADHNRHRYRVTIQSITKTSLNVLVHATIQGPTPPRTHIVLAQAILKGDHMNWAIQKATELGVSEIVPLITKRVIARPKPEKFSSLQERYTRIATDAAQQSEQWALPKVSPPTPFQAFIETSGAAAIRGILVERQNLNGLESLALERGTKGCIVLMAGPEGGWTQTECETARTNNFTPLSLGETIFRGETAPLVALSIIQFQLGNLGRNQAQS